MKKRTIELPLESYLYLNEVCSNQRLGRSLSPKGIELATSSFETFSENGWKVVIEGDFGGAIGEPVNSYEEGRWTTWKIEDMKILLDEKNLPYRDGKDVGCVDIYL